MRSPPTAEPGGTSGGEPREGDASSPGVPSVGATPPSPSGPAPPAVASAPVAAVPESLSRLRFGKDRRLRSRASIRLVYDEGTRERGRFVSLFLREREPADAETGGAPAPWRVGITVTRKVSPKSVVRNRMRRRIREFFRNEQWKIEPGWDFVVNAQGPLEKATTPDLAAELRRMIARGIRSARSRRKDPPNSEAGPGSKDPRTPRPTNSPEKTREKSKNRPAKKPTTSTPPSKSPAPDGKS